MKETLLLEISIYFFVNFGANLTLTRILITKTITYTLTLTLEKVVKNAWMNIPHFCFILKIVSEIVTLFLKLLYW